MVKKMLIDATHSEETRVAVVDGNRLIDFDYESKVRKQLKGGIFLAKVTRIEPSLQAAFVNFGGNRHGFLPFSEIHPDYFRIPIADREALLEEQTKEIEARIKKEEELDQDDDGSADSDDEDDVSELGGEDDVAGGNSKSKRSSKNPKDTKKKPRSSSRAKPKKKSDDAKPSKSAKDNTKDNKDDNIGNVIPPEEEINDADGNTISGNGDNTDGNSHNQSKNNNRRGKRGGRGRRPRKESRSRSVETVGGDNIEGDQPMRPSMRKNYKIQEVVKRGQIMLIQVSKEERGNKGAAVTTYLSLPGRYCVLMPNSPRAGGVSRKIANYKDRKRMREILKELSVPNGMSVIMRTAGVARNKTEIKRDLDYLIRLWNNIRELTLESSAPALVHEEGNLIRRSIRDIYSRDIDEILISGDKGYKRGREFMKMLIPSHAKNVKKYEDDRIPLFHRYQVEKQIDEIGTPTVVLPSGGYLVINPTEALVSVDVNSGKSTKGRHIEETAVKTNLEAAEEVARQLKLRDLGGLVVIDFIDMEDRRNNRKVENKLKNALSTDRARIQIGRISSFGLLELSRQRLNPSLTEAQYKTCPHCEGIGNVKSTDAMAISVLRALEEEGIKERSTKIVLMLSPEIATYILNKKRKHLAEIETRYGFDLDIQTSETIGHVGYVIEPAIDGQSQSQAQAQSQSQSKSSDDKSDNDSQNNKGGRRDRNNRRNKPRRDHKNNRNNSSSDNENQKDHSKAEDKAKNNGDSQSDDKKHQKSSSQKPSQAITKNQNEDNSANDKKDVKEKTSKQAEKQTNDKKTETSDNKEASDKKAPKKEAAPKKSAAAKKDKEKKSSDKKESKSAANDSDTNTQKDFEVVNEAPEKKKKGWWSKK